jgi:hypothetical protein
MKDKNTLTKGNIYRFDYLSRMGRFHYQNVTFARSVETFYYDAPYGSDVRSGNYSFVDANNEPIQVVDWMVNEKTVEVVTFGKNERNFLRQDW